MDFHKYKPSPPLSHYVEYLWYLSDRPSHALERIVPTGTFELVINLADEAFSVHESLGLQSAGRPAGAVISGPVGRYFLIDTRDHASIIGAHFRPGCVLPFIGCHADDIGAGYVELEALWGQDARRVREQLCEVATAEVRLRILELALTERLVNPHKLRSDVCHALQALQVGTAPVSEIAAELGLSHRRFVEVFSAQVGTTPKLYGRIQRFHRAMRIAVTGRVPSWGALAVECGYFDQSHMYRDFKEFSGLTPESLARNARVPVKDSHIAVA